MTPPLIPVSWGELLDKITILEIKSQRLTAAAALANVRAELEALRAIPFPLDADQQQVAQLAAELAAVNGQLWDIEDAIREKEAQGDFGPEFITLARSVYKRNDERARIKRRVNVALSSALVEEKGYSNY